MDSWRHCDVCNICYSHWYEFQHHRATHNKFINRCRIISYLKSTKKEAALFSAVVPAYIVYETTELLLPHKYFLKGIKNPRSLKPTRTLYCGEYDTGIVLLQRNCCTMQNDKFNQALSDAVTLGFMSTALVGTRREHYFTTKGFTALARLIEHDLICQPVDNP